MGTPTQRHNRSRKGRSQSHLALKKTTLTKCPNCGKEILPHRACRFCKMYKGKKY